MKQIYICFMPYDRFAVPSLHVSIYSALNISEAYRQNTYDKVQARPGGNGSN